MTEFQKHSSALVLMVIVTVLAASRSQAQTLTISLNSHNVNFSLVHGSPTNLGSNSVNVTTNWVMGTRRRTLTVYSYFANAAAALSGPGGNIPSASFSISANGTAFRPYTYTEPFGGANAGRRVVADIPITGTGTRTDSMVFNIDLSTGTLPQLRAGTYTGTLTIQAQAI